jgi:hypothetical protein
VFSRNLNISSLSNLNGRLIDNLSKEKPFGKKGVVMVTKGGSAFTVYGRQLEQDIKEFFKSGSATNKVLRP